MERVEKFLKEKNPKKNLRIKAHTVQPKTGDLVKTLFELAM